MYIPKPPPGPFKTWVRLEQRKSSEDSGGGGGGSAEDSELGRDREGAHGTAAELGQGAVIHVDHAIWRHRAQRGEGEKGIQQAKQEKTRQPGESKSFQQMIMSQTILPRRTP